jgi:hypothetical protein
MSSWFYNAYGFEETLNYSKDQQTFQKLYSDGNYKTINGINVGQFSIIDKDKLVLTGTPGARVTLSHIVGDVIKLHKDPNNNNATFQVASQMNCLEMIGPRITPERGLTIYDDDDTQGPKCAVATPAGLAYRQYLCDVRGKKGQTAKNQIDTSEEARAIISASTGGKAKGCVKNGYLFYTVEELQAFNGVNFNKVDINLGVGSHTNLGVFIGGIHYTHNVNHVYCSGLPISYTDVDPSLWRKISQVFLDAIYENTLLIACGNNRNSGQDKSCFLTLVGGGVFGMEHDIIYEAINRACKSVVQRGLSLDVKVVHYWRDDHCGLKPVIFS